MRTPLFSKDTSYFTVQIRGFHMYTRVVVVVYGGSYIGVLYILWFTCSRVG